MATPSLPDISALSSLPDEQLTGVLDLLFEPSKQIHDLLLPQIRTRTFASYPDLIDTARHTFLQLQGSANDSDKETLLSILGSHPRLGAKKVESAQSAAEQAQLQAAEGSEETVKLARLNKEYEARFPGLCYVVFVNGRPRDTIMANMEARIARGDFSQEEVEAIEAMSDIAKDRAGKLLRAAQP